MFLAPISILAISSFSQLASGASQADEPPSLHHIPRCLHDCILSQLPSIDCIYTDLECQCEHAQELYVGVQPCAAANCTEDEGTNGERILRDICEALIGIDVTDKRPGGGQGDMDGGDDEGGGGQLSPEAIAGIVVGALAGVVVLVLLGVAGWRVWNGRGLFGMWKESGRGVSMRKGEEDLNTAETREWIWGGGHRMRNGNEPDSRRSNNRRRWSGRKRERGVARNEFMHPVELDGNLRPPVEIDGLRVVKTAHGPSYEHDLRVGDETRRHPEGGVRAGKSAVRREGRGVMDTTGWPRGL